MNQNVSYIPNTLPVTSGAGILATPTDPDDYDYKLQELLDKTPYHPAGSGENNSAQFQDAGNFRFVMELGDKISKLADIPFINMAQAHLWFNGNGGEVRREPTNEELNMLSNVAVAYGARGIIYFAFNSDNTLTSPTYSRGFVEPNLTPRYYNVYEQNKWDEVKTMIKRLKNLGPTIMSFDNENRKSYILRSEYSDLYSQSFFSDVITYKPYFGINPSCSEENPNSNVSGTVYECKEKRYLQVATFHNDDANTKFFMIVNRRCSPFTNDSTDDKNGGRRFVKIKLDSGSVDFAGFNNWCLKDVSSDSLITIFDKNAGSDINLGWYLPGEGKLYKLAPVMQEGGTLVADESVSGIQFVCKGMVLNNGKNISIGSGTNISFQTGTGINMTGGNFICDGGSGSDYNKLIGYNGQNWNGINLTNTLSSTKIEKTTFENTKSPLVIYNSLFSAQYAQKIIRRNIFIFIFFMRNGYVKTINLEREKNGLPLRIAN